MFRKNKRQRYKCFFGVTPNSTPHWINHSLGPEANDQSPFVSTPQWIYINSKQLTVNYSHTVHDLPNSHLNTEGKSKERADGKTQDAKTKKTLDLGAENIVHTSFQYHCFIHLDSLCQLQWAHACVRFTSSTLSTEKTALRMQKEHLSLTFTIISVLTQPRESGSIPLKKQQTLFKD